MQTTHILMSLKPSADDWQAGETVTASDDGGLVGLLASASRLDLLETDKPWAVLEVDADRITVLDGGVARAPNGRVVYCGSPSDALRARAAAPMVTRRWLRQVAERMVGAREWCPTDIDAAIAFADEAPEFVWLCDIPKSARLDWAEMLHAQPLLVDHVPDLGLLSGPDWVLVLYEQPQLIDRVPNLRVLTNQDWHVILGKHPQLERYRPA